MRYKVTFQKHEGAWVYVIAFGEGTPTSIQEAAEFSDSHVSAEDPHGIRHFDNVLNLAHI